MKEPSTYYPLLPSTFYEIFVDCPPKWIVFKHTKGCLLRLIKIFEHEHTFYRILVVEKRASIMALTSRVWLGRWVIAGNVLGAVAAASVPGDIMDSAALVLMGLQYSSKLFHTVLLQKGATREQARGRIWRDPGTERFLWWSRRHSWVSFWSTHVYISSFLEDVFKVLGNVSFHLPYKEHSVLLRNPKEDWAGSPSLSSRPGILISHMTLGKWPVFIIFSVHPRVVWWGCTPLLWMVGIIFSSLWPSLSF